jgi:hypothetical protein
MVPPLVAAHIKTHHLYEASAGQFGSVKGPQSAAHELHEQESI